MAIMTYPNGAESLLIILTIIIRSGDSHAMQLIAELMWFAELAFPLVEV